MIQSLKNYQAVSIPDVDNQQSIRSVQRLDCGSQYNILTVQQKTLRESSVPQIPAPLRFHSKPQSQLDKPSTKPSFLPSIAKSNHQLQSKPKPTTLLPKRPSLNSDIVADTKRQILNNKIPIFKASKSLHLTKNKQKTLKDEHYLPAFIRNFQLPPKKKLQVVQTMDIFKKRQAAIKDFLEPPEFLNKYKILSHIGKGTFSIVSQALNFETHTKMAIKTYVKFDQIQDYKFTNIIRQIENMKILNKHKNVVQIESVVIEKRKVMLIMQNCGQQSLAGILRKRKNIPQNEAKNLFRQIIEGITYCHQNNVCHRDLKLQNILVDDSQCIKIIDFGFSSKTEKPLGSFCGTPPYMAPQIVSRKIYEGKGTDIWSIGVILYVMLYGFFPFRSNQESQLFRLIQQGKFQHNQTISQGAKDTINMMLKTGINQRATSMEVLNAKWLQA